MLKGASLYNLYTQEQSNASNEPGILDQISPTSVIFNGFSLIKDTGHYIGNCQRPVFSLSVSQHMHKITNLLKKLWLSWSSKLRDNNGRKNTLVKRRCVLSDA